MRLARRTLLKGGLLGLTALMSKSVFVGCGSDDASSNGSGGTPGKDSGPPLQSNLASVGELGAPATNGVRVPAGFTARIVAKSGEAPIAGSSFVWHSSPDGGATYAKSDGGYVYVSNSELPLAGGVGALVFDAEGKLVDAYRILEKSNINCSGGKTSWNTWLSCEEASKGRVFECDPFGEKQAITRPALGIFKHEAVAEDPESHVLYLTEDEDDGCFYRFTPDSVDDGVANLESGKLEVASVASDGKVTWHPLSDPEFTGDVPTRQQVAEATIFDGGEGIAHHAGVIYLSTKGDNRIWAYDIDSATIVVHYDAATAANPILTGVDAVTMTCCGDVLVAEDGGDMQVVALLADGSIKPLLQIMGHEGSEVTGIAFDPSGMRLYLSSQRGLGGNSGGITYEISGPFHRVG